MDGLAVEADIDQLAILEIDVEDAHGLAILGAILKRGVRARGVLPARTRPGGADANAHAHPNPDEADPDAYGNAQANQHTHATTVQHVDASADRDTSA